MRTKIALTYYCKLVWHACVCCVPVRLCEINFISILLNEMIGQAFSGWHGGAHLIYANACAKWLKAT